jgi:hypothetical protein
MERQMISRISSSSTHAWRPSVHWRTKSPWLRSCVAKSGWQKGSDPRLRVSALRFGLAIAWRSSISPSLTGTEVATWSVERRRMVFPRMK